MTVKSLRTAVAAAAIAASLSAAPALAQTAGIATSNPGSIFHNIGTAVAKAANETNMKPDMMIIDYKGIKFDKNRQNELATGVVTQIGWDDEKHTIWPWDLAAQAGFKPIYPSPSWQERESKSKK